MVLLGRNLCSNMYYVYIIQCEDGSLYTGITTDVKRRFEEHKMGLGGHYTSSHKAKRLVYKEKIGTRSQALKREAEIKSFTRARKLNLVNKKNARK